MKIIPEKKEKVRLTLKIEVREENIIVLCDGGGTALDCLNAWSALTKSILSQGDDEGFSAEENLDCRRLLARMMGEKLAEIIELLPSLKAASKKPH
jgi:hypothetical protein